MTEREIEIYLTRVKQFYKRLETHYFAEKRDFSARLGHSVEPTPFAERDRLEYVPVAAGDTWGSLWDSAWIELDGEIPPEWAGKPVSCRINAGGEGLIFDESGCPVWSLAISSVCAHDYRKEWYHFTDAAKPGKFSLLLEVAANGLFGAEGTGETEAMGVRPGPCSPGHIIYLQYGIFNREVWALHLDVEIMLGLLGYREGGTGFNYSSGAYRRGSYRESQLLAVLNRAADVYADNPANAAAARRVLATELKRPASSGAMRVAAVGHAHIDTGWLWPVRETVRKVARTFSSQLALIEKYPGYVFGASQAQHFAFLKEFYPQLFEKVKAAVKSGRFELQGGMWVECDCNLTSGESLVRQFIHGKNFFRDEFGFEVKNLWLPDVFGYSAALPQIIRKSGCDYFVTQKICWNQYNKFPYHAFHWYGIDNSQVISFFPPENNYNSALVPNQLNFGADNFEENAVLDEYLSLFGVGDGGGGPKEEYIERGLRCRDLDGCPKVSFSRADDFLERLSRHSDLLPDWHGELYLEIHRGTLTTQARTKFGNRRCEQMLTATEVLCSLLPADQYPKRELDRFWKLLLLNQFHDILPGSSIRLVYERTEREHREILDGCAELVRQAATNFAAADNVVTFVNTLGHPFRGMVELPGDWEGARDIPCERHGDRLYAALEMAPLASRVVFKGGSARVAAPAREFVPVLENAKLRAAFSADGRLTSLYDKELGREFIAAPGNDFSLYIDIPHNYDAWEIDLNYENECAGKAELVDMRMIASGALRQTLQLDFKVGEASTIRQEISLDADGGELLFFTSVDWHETHRMLRVAFPTTVIAQDATFDIQYGYLRRPTNRNTSWDKARFEVACQRYFDLSDSESGLAILNDGKYGCKVLNGVMDFNVLRSPLYPDPEADRGVTSFTFALLPHRGGAADADVVERAAALNRRPLRLDGVELEAAFPCRLENGDGVAIEVLKRAEKSDDFVVRLVEQRGRRGSCRLVFAPGISAAAECDLLEWRDLAELQVTNHGVDLEFTPFEIKTVRFR